MYIYKFIPSPDVAAYCKKIGHVFNTLEMAVLIDRDGLYNPMPLRERNRYYQELVDRYPDMPFHESVKFKVRSSVHDYLRALIAWNEAAIKYITAPNKKTQKKLVYKVTSFSLGELGLGEKVDTLKDFMREFPEYKSFETFDELLEDIRPYWDKEKTPEVRIMAERVWRGEKQTLFPDVNYEGEITRIQSDYVVSGKKHPGFLHTLFIHIPVPFQVGDIVMDEQGIPYVLKSLPQCKEGPIESVSGANEWHFKEYLASTPAGATYYYVTPNGSIKDSYPFFPFIPLGSGSEFCYPENLRWYKGELKGPEKMLFDLSAYIKENGTDATAN